MTQQFNTGDTVCMMKNGLAHKRTVEAADENVAIVDGVQYVQWSGREVVAGYEPSTSSIWHWKEIDDMRLSLQKQGLFDSAQNKQEAIQ